MFATLRVMAVKTTKTKESEETLQTVSIIDEISELQAQLDSKKEAAIQEILAQRQKLDTLLEKLGYETQVVPFGGSPKRRSRQVTAKSDEQKYCKICEVSGHDARKHKGQTVKKKFTQEEIAKLGL